MGKGFSFLAPALKLGYELGGERLATGLAALATTHEHGRQWAVEIEVAPLRLDQLRATQARSHQGHQHEPVAPDKPHLAVTSL